MMYRPTQRFVDAVRFVKNNSEAVIIAAISGLQLAETYQLSPVRFKIQ